MKSMNRFTLIGEVLGNRIYQHLSYYQIRSTTISYPFQIPIQNCKVI